MATIAGGRVVRDLDQLDELIDTGARIDAAASRRFLDRLDRLMLAVEGYASPELVLDVLLLAWPRPSGAAWLAGRERFDDRIETAGRHRPWLRPGRGIPLVRAARS